MKKPPLTVIVGPTGSGKSSLAVELARAIGSGVISADSRQVYRGLDIGTEKLSKRDMRGVPHYGIDIASPRRAFSVASWRRHAQRACAHIERTMHAVPIVAGGTGLYIDALVYGLEFPAVPPNMTLRRELESWTVEAMYAHLFKIDPVRAQSIEPQNPRRLMRAIEVATALGKVPVISLRNREPLYQVTWIGLNPPFSDLEQRIAERIDHALKRGLVNETRMLHEELHISWNRINELGLEYRISGAFMRGELSKDSLRDTLIRDVRRYAKKQYTWLKRYREVAWYTSAEEALFHVATPHP